MDTVTLKKIIDTAAKTPERVGIDITDYNQVMHAITEEYRWVRSDAIKNSMKELGWSHQYAEQMIEPCVIRKLAARYAPALIEEDLYD